MKYRVVTDYASINKEKWTEFVQNHPNGNIFQTPEFYSIYFHTKNYAPFIVSVIGEDDEIFSILLGAIQQEGGLPFGYFTSRAVIDGGPLVLNNDEIIMELTLSELSNVIKHKTIYTLFRNYWVWKDLDSVFNDKGYKYSDHLNILVDLTLPIADLWSAVHKYRRKEIKKATGKGLIVNPISTDNHILIDESYTILYKLYSKLKIPIPDKSFFDYAINLLKEKQMIKVFGAFLEDKLIGVRYVLCYNSTIFDWYAGSLDEYLPYHPNDLLPWEVFKWGCETGFRTFDFGGAGNPKKAYGVRDYKLKFGGSLYNPGRFTRVNNPVLFYLIITLYNLRKSFT